ncbi:MAG: hypothetical protein IPM54_21350 [Polyangiaceae bacterium]|nr:hypothetical protein [Polyangiaceae bacterium]
MKGLQWQVGMLSVSSLLMVACSDPAVGTWEADEKASNGQRSEFVLTDEGDKLQGEGDFQIQGIGAVIECTGKIVAEIKRDREYAVEVQWQGADGCDMIPDTDYDCTLEKDDTQLDCGTEGGLWNRIE